MIKKAIFVLSALIALAVNASAQQTGSWHYYPLYAGQPDKVEVADNGTVYYLSAGRLYSFDGEENRDFVNDFSGRKITYMKYNADADYLFVGCEQGDISLVYPDGHTARLSDIADANLRYEKTINAADFKGDDVIVATTFGLVRFDTKTMTVKESGVTGKNVKAVAHLGDRFIVSFDGAIRSIKAGALLSDLSNFTTLVENRDAIELARLGAAAIAVRLGTGIYTYSINGDVATEVRPYSAYTNVPAFINARPTPYYIVNKKELRRFKSDATDELAATLAAPLNSGAVTLGIADGLKDVWAGTADGMALYDLSAATPTVKTEPFKPVGSIGVEKVGYIRSSRDGKRIYVGNLGNSNLPIADWGGTQKLFRLDSDGSIHNLSIANRSQPGFPTEDIDDPSILYVGQTSSGAAQIQKDGKAVKNLPGSWTYDVAIDPEGNLWTVRFGTGNNDGMYFLPNAKRKTLLTTTTNADWTTSNKALNSFRGRKDAQILFCRHSNMMVSYETGPNEPLMFYNTQGTYSNLADDKGENFVYINDQDGRSIWVAGTSCIAEDAKGQIWLATNAGVYVVTDPTNPSTTLRSVKVPRNDGTGYADYLLDGIRVYDIEVDANNNKWFATSSGVYQTNADGSQILQHFDKSNSPLPDNTVTAVYADPLSNNIYVGTLYGLLRYSSMTAPAATDYSDVYAYPNPVKPDYTGWISIVNLMDNSLVKIADASGNVVYSGRSNGGMFTWDGCNASGSRVKSGVYYVFASHSDGSSGNGDVVAKILIMN